MKTTKKKIFLECLIQSAISAPKYAFLGLGFSLLGCGDLRSRSEASSEIQTVKTNDAKKTIYVDTHDQYGHTDKITPANFPYFKKVEGKPAIGLTFDCAWVDVPNGTKILDFLKSHNIRTTFFISGPFIFKNYLKGRAGGLNRTNLKMVRKMVLDGHEFGNHTQTHPHNTSTIDWSKENVELLSGWNEIVALAFKGESVPDNAKMQPFWRAPYGEYDDRSLRLAAGAGFPLHFGWNVDSFDSTGLPSCIVDKSNPKCLDDSKMTKRIVDFAQKNNWKFNGMVVLAHLQNPYDWTRTPAGLEQLVQKFRDNGVEFRRLSEMFNETLAPDVKFAIAK